MIQKAVTHSFGWKPRQIHCFATNTTGRGFWQMPVSHYIPEDQCLSHGDQHSEKNVELSVFISYRYTALHEKGDTSRSPSRKGAKFNKMHIFYSALDVLTFLLCEHVHTVQKWKWIVIQADWTHGFAKRMKLLSMNLKKKLNQNGIQF